MTKSQIGKENLLTKSFLSNPHTLLGFLSPSSHSIFTEERHAKLSLKKLLNINWE
jgi:hypothetical protein